MLSNFNVLLGVSGGIACYKSCDIVSRLKKLGAGVDVIMTSHATEFVSPLSFETLSARRVVVDMFDTDRQWEVEHISLAKKADICVVAPATANVIAKLADGIADDMLTTTCLALKCPIVIAPAMNTNMYDSPTVRDNLKKLRRRGVIIVDPVEGRLACGDSGKGKMAEPADIVNEVIYRLLPKRDYEGKKVLVTAGATRENIDGVRFITNRSSGKMGIEIAKEVVKRGGEVVLVKGLVQVEVPKYITKVISVESTAQMYDAVMANYSDCDMIIKAAAPSDYRPAAEIRQKLKGDEITLHLVKNPDIAKAVGQVKEHRKLIIFSAETQNLFTYAKDKLADKNADMVVANDVTEKGAGFDVDTNVVTLIKRNGMRKCYPVLSKSKVAGIILDEALK
ncbi:MAG: bifunctional phosphopantothenoylcysteine decarboxylase/phosphopantothenate--cysteine ligase CoaBC [Clostridia bacterium]|jgi:phosphopantothenoylcysteine decarboxylase/phosphopantothenate--cysteine ligase|nr:bifunctional phosphopantothenoylcysteine decarboxylase/phosphopantothenate--cysteine ligase CoaBC [Clostridia bacterium]MCI9290838.1 bifunctional phosphopantothenoylcysteine decarboxylase/phosphopantothenate--cysteine ligase CoaBC [Clostridia bacterium]MDE6884681.1 bifunctional phosphopantothenoylcysteine decarboxylase/phosphopantothenate--cysteine ligase CoaBC [Clostridia bacterium]